MSGFVVSYERQLREAFAAGQAASMASLLSKHEGAGEYFAKTPKTYEEWIASISDRPSVVRG